MELTTNSQLTGYGHSDYALSLSEFGRPRLLPKSGAWILERGIPAFEFHDAMGCYPIFVCADWSQLAADLEDLGDEIVCLSVVSDPFGDYDLSYLERCFPDVARPFKNHFVIDLSRPLKSFAHPHHLRNARKALGEMSVELCASPIDYLEEWIALYAKLIERHDIHGLAAFSRESFAKQLRVPGLVAFRAFRNDETLGMLLWYVQGDKAYYHLGAYSSAGYDRRASFALFSHSIEYFARQGIAWLNLGAGAGVGADADSGLNRFKRGWSTGTRTAYFCGRIFDRGRYQEIVTSRNIAAGNFFPAYRVGEFS